jgi:hypothetical protein
MMGGCANSLGNAPGNALAIVNEIMHGGTMFGWGVGGIIGGCHRGNIRMTRAGNNGEAIEG